MHRRLHAAAATKDFQIEVFVAPEFGRQQVGHFGPTASIATATDNLRDSLVGLLQRNLHPVRQPVLVLEAQAFESTCSAGIQIPWKTPILAKVRISS